MLIIMGDDIVDDWEAQSVSGDENDDVVVLDSDDDVADDAADNLAQDDGSDGDGNARPSKRRRLEKLKEKRRAWNASKQREPPHLAGASASQLAAIFAAALSQHEPVSPAMAAAAVLAEADDDADDHEEEAAAAAAAAQATYPGPSHFVSIAGAKGAPREHNVANLHAFLSAALGGGTKVQSLLQPSYSQRAAAAAAQAAGLDAGEGSAAVLIVCASAARAVALASKAGLGQFNCRVAKLFSKHMKPREQVRMLAQQRYFGLAVGTPNRLLKLASEGALSLGATKLLVVDMYRNEKRQTILDVKETAADLAALYRSMIRSRLQEGMKICLY